MAKPNRKSSPIAALDVGSSKVACFIAQFDDEDVLTVRGFGHNRSRGVRGGQVSDMAALQAAIAEAVDGAEQTAGLRIEEVLVNVSGASLFSRNVEAEVTIPHNHPVRNADVRRVLDQGRQLHLHAAQAAYSLGGQGNSPQGGSEIIHCLPTSYTIDGGDGIVDPRGMYGQRLGVRIHVVSSTLGPLRNLATVIERCHLDIADRVAAPYASALACTVDDEKEMGVTVVDMGGGTTSVSVFVDGQPVYADCIPVGGQHVTNDLAKGLSTPVTAAERLKTVYGTVIPSPRDSTEMLPLKLVGEDDDQPSGHEVPRSELVRIVRPRMEETFELVRARLADARMLHAAGRRVVLTGGASQLQGVREMAELILDKQVRLGRPRRLKGLPEEVSGPAFSTCAGLLRYAVQDQVVTGLPQKEGEADEDGEHQGGAFARVGSWLKELLG